jgi:GMP synthase (glutamine-hydrolysing)
MELDWGVLKSPGVPPVPDPILIILHQEHSTPGRVGRLLRERGHALDIRRPRYGDPLPETLAGHAGAVIFGGPMSANDTDDWIKREIDWIGVPLSEGKPFLGICLGAQMMVKKLGGRVARHPDGRAEIGYWPITPTPLGEALFDWPSHVYHWHSEGFERPECCEQLATGETFENQAIRRGQAFGIQFHPEVTHAMLCRWTVSAHDKLAVPGAQDRATQIERRFQYDPAVHRWLETFLDAWLAPSPAHAQVPG